MMRIACLVPDLPSAQELGPRFAQIAARRWYTNFGEQEQEFEREIRTFLGALADREVFVALANSGTAALELALASLALPSGSLVAVPALTFAATAHAVIRTGHTPVFMDVDRERWQLTPDIVQAHPLRDRIAAVMPVATYGVPVAADAWARFSRAEGIPVVVDAAAAFGMQTLCAGPLFCFSLHATKPLGIGEGGIVVTADESRAASMRIASNFGYVGGEVVAAGANYKLSEWAAATGIVQLQRWPLIRSRRDAVFSLYRRLFASSPVQLQAGGQINWPGVLVIRLPTAMARGAVEASLSMERIETRRWYLPPVHRHPYFAQVMRGRGITVPELPVTDALADTLTGLPFHNFLSDEDCTRVADAVLRSVRDAG